MKYIKGTKIKETPIKVVTDEGEIEMSDNQLRSLGYKPVDEVIIEQGDELMEVIPSATELKQELMDSIEVEYPKGGLPFKLGYKWTPKYVNGKIIFESVRDANAVGTNENPIIFVNNVKLVPNGFYLYEEELYVYVGLRHDNASSWDEVSGDMEKF